MQFINEIEKLNSIMKDLEKEREESIAKYCEIAKVIEKLLLVIELDNFNSSQGYNYCRNLKELLIKRRNYAELNSKYKRLIKSYNIKEMELNVSRKKGVLDSRGYKARVIKDDEDILGMLKEE